MIVSYAVHNKFSKQNLACHACHGPKRMTTHNHHHNSKFSVGFFLLRPQQQQTWYYCMVIGICHKPTTLPQLLHKKKRGKKEMPTRFIYSEGSTSI
jgi:hypothetical protein